MLRLRGYVHMTYRDKIRLAIELRRTRRKYKDLDEEDPVQHAEEKQGDLEPGEPGDGRIVRKRIEDQENWDD
jgi:hypothetical protein